MRSVYVVLCDACNGYTRTKQFCVMAETHVFYATFAGRMERLKIIADDKIPFLKGVMEPYADIVYLPGAAITASDVKDADALFTRTRTLCNETLLKGTSISTRTIAMRQASDGSMHRGVTLRPYSNILRRHASCWRMNGHCDWPTRRSE